MSAASCNSRRANSTRWNCPPESAPTRRLRKSSRPSVASASATARLRRAIEAAPDADLAPKPHGHAVEHRDREAAVDVDLLRQIGDVAAVVSPSRLRLPPSGLSSPDDALEQGRLAGAVRPDQREQLAAVDLAGDVMHGGVAVVAERQIVEADGRRLAHGSSRAPTANEGPQQGGDGADHGEARRHRKTQEREALSRRRRARARAVVLMADAASLVHGRASLPHGVANRVRWPGLGRLGRAAGLAQPGDLERHLLGRDVLRRRARAAPARLCRSAKSRPPSRIGGRWRRRTCRRRRRGRRRRRPSATAAGAPCRVCISSFRAR